MTLTRRTLLVTAVAAGASAGLGALIMNGDVRPASVWRGPALGGEARVSLYGADHASAQVALSAIAAELSRLEDIFSLHRAGSEISRLNRDCRLAQPSPDMVAVLRSAMTWRTRTAGAFDPTVQPLWQAAADGIAVSPALLAACGTVLEISHAEIAMPTGSAVTLNGIAQGYITDRMTDVLAAHGFDDVAIEAGELRLVGSNRRAVGIPSVKAAISVASVAIATSEPKFKVFNARTFRHHLIEPKTGLSPRHWESISVFAPTAEAADALSTAFAVLPHEAVGDLVSAIGTVAIIGADGRGRVRRFGDVRSVSGAKVS